MIYNISYDIAAIPVLVVLAVGMKTVLYTDSPGAKLVRRYVYCVLGSAILDIVTAYTISFPEHVSDPANMILNTLYHFSSALCIAVAMQTIFSYYPNISRTNILINRCLIGLLVALISVNLFTGIQFSFDNGAYVHGPLFLMSYILSFSIVLHTFFVVLMNRSARPKTTSHIMLMFLFTPIVFSVIQMISGNVLLNGFGEAFAALILLFAMETPDYRKLMKTMKELEAAKEEANIANRTKSDFLASMSHEIRTPINGILGMDTMILRDCDDPQIVEYAENIRIAGNGLLSIINDILDLSKIESGKMELVPVRYELYSILNDCFQMNRMRASESGLKFTIGNDADMPAEYFGDEVRIRQILNNLVSNGLKYTKEGSVTVNVGYSDADPAVYGTNGEYVNIIISVKDTGIGIKEEDLNRLFESFTRLEEGRNRHIEGTGLGLRITRQLVDMMKGKLDVSSVYGEGSVFTVTIPQKVESHKRMGDFGSRLKQHITVAKSKVSSIKAPGRKVLIVDDVKMNILVFKGLLRGTEMQIDAALSGPESIEMTKQTKYDIIFMDHLMPDMDGIEAFRAIHDDPDNINHDTPVIVLTANAIVGVRAGYIKEGFADYLSKPVEQDVLLNSIKEIIHIDEQAEG